MARAKKPPKPDSSQDSPDDEAGVDGVLERLEDVVAELEAGELPLERALDRFAEGVRLARRGGQMLDAVEERVEMLLADRDEVAPLANNDDD